MGATKFRAFLRTRSGLWLLTKSINRVIRSNQPVLLGIRVVYRRAHEILLPVPRLGEALPTTEGTLSRNMKTFTWYI